MKIGYSSQCNILSSIYYFIYNLAGFSFKTIGSLNLSKDKVLCCHFSSDGKLLASAGHDKNV